MNFNAHDFHNAISALRFIEAYQLEEIGMPEHKIVAFLADPYLGYLACDDERQARIWALIERQKV